jgi:rhodanese-related sulfurtransferase
MIARLMGLRTITPEGVQQLLRERRVTVVDVNSVDRWTEAHVPGAVNLNPLTYTEEQLPRDKGTSVVFYCSGAMCRKAPDAARRAITMGYRDVKVMSAGIRGWIARELPTERSEQEPAMLA